MAVRIMTVVCQKQRWKQRDVVIAPQKIFLGRGLNGWLGDTSNCCLHPLLLPAVSVVFSFYHDHDLPLNLTTFFFFKPKPQFFSNLDQEVFSHVS